MDPPDGALVFSTVAVVGEQTLRELVRRGHVLGFVDGGFGGYQAVARDPKTGVYRGASEPRKDGQAAGY